jgi:ATP-dependent DNA ligase
VALESVLIDTRDRPDTFQARKDGEAVRLFTRRGYDWSGHYPAIAVTASQLRARSFTLDGEA